jgi:uncharacterized protein (DUF305 family)
MKKHLIITGVFVATALASSFAGGYAVHALTDSKTGSQAKANCPERLHQAMEDMHMQMHTLKSSGDLDEDFVRLMLPHHEAAIEMAKVELLCGKDEVNRRLAQEIIADQQSEIELMRLWLSNHDSRNPSRSVWKEERKNP